MPFTSRCKLISTQHKTAKFLWVSAKAFQLSRNILKLLSDDKIRNTRRKPSNYQFPAVNFFMLRELSTFCTMKDIYLHYKPRVSYNIGNALSWMLSMLQDTHKSKILSISKLKLIRDTFLGALPYMCLNHEKLTQQNKSRKARWGMIRS